MLRPSWILSISLLAPIGCGSPVGTEPPQQIENVLDCGQPAPCDIVVNPSGDPGSPPPTSYSGALTCALQTLAKGEPARIHYNDGCEGACTGEVLLLRGDNSVIVQRYSQSFNADEGVVLDGIMVDFKPFSESQLCKLKDAAYFNTCLGAYDNACTASASWVTDCATPAPACEP